MSKAVRPSPLEQNPAGNAPDNQSDEAHRLLFLSQGATNGEAEELLAYARNAFDTRFVAIDEGNFPVADEPFVSAWEGYAVETSQRSVSEVLSERLVQLRFPVAEGMSESFAYQAAVRRGVTSGAPAQGVRFLRPDGLRLFVHQTPAGRIPVLVADARQDFVSFVQAFTRRNEPVPIPDAMGACIVAGYSNWDRVSAIRRQWEIAHPQDAGDAAWAAEFKRLVPRRELYQDVFIVLSTGPYSAAPAGAFGFSDKDWKDVSLTIRLEHECAHYFTRRILGSMRNSLLDEIIADYAGIVAANSRYRGDWFLRFMGLEHFPNYRSGGRLENYRGQPPLSSEAFRVLQRLVERAASNLERFDNRLRAGGGVHAQPWQTAETRARVLVALARLGLGRIAADDGDERLWEIFVRQPRTTPSM